MLTLLAFSFLIDPGTLTFRCTLWFCTQTLIAGSQFAPSRLRQRSGVCMPDDLTWRQVEPGQELSFTFDGRGRGRQNNSQEIKINQLVVKMDGWQGTYFTKKSNCRSFD
jgi:hypothetical protein